MSAPPPTAPPPVALDATEAAPQDLATGAAGQALLAIERALRGTGDWSSVHSQLAQATAGRIDAGPHTSLYYGAPALAFVLHTASADGRRRFAAEADTLVRHVERIAHQRVAAATERMTHGGGASFSEYDLFYGLAGIGRLLLRAASDSDALAEILRYLVRLTRPLHVDDTVLPGWWVDHDPDSSVPAPGGHANFGMAHGAAGILALLSLATLEYRTVNGQREAITDLLTFFDAWQVDASDGPVWPTWITRPELTTGRPTSARPSRPSWCYGTVGIARAQQLAGLALGDPARCRTAEDALAAGLADIHLDRVTDIGLCHGIAGIYQTTHRAAAQASTPGISRRLPAVAAVPTRHDSKHAPSDLLTGMTGVHLATETARHGTPKTGWDTCLLIT